ncbi:MAG: hypothetical protein JNL48_09955 [Acidobacteria bacterium]|nr:hypothetical protein [Acidobacteriota bacterium]
MRTRHIAAAVVLAALCGSPAGAQPAASYDSGSAFYLAYRQAFDKATTIDELLPWVAKGRAEQIAKAPDTERREAFAMIKMFDDRTNVTVTRETPSAAGAELQVEGVSAEGRGKATGVITLVKEGGAWRIERESWKGGGGR